MSKHDKKISDEEVDRIVAKKQLSDDDINLLCDWIEEQKEDLEE